MQDRLTRHRRAAPFLPGVIDMEAFSIISLNLWMDYEFETRKPSIEAFLLQFQPEVFCFQELSSEGTKLVVATLGENYECILEYTKGVSIFWKKTVRLESWSLLDSCRCLSAKFSYKDYIINVHTVHLHWVGDFTFKVNENTVLRELEEILPAIDPVNEEYNFVTGDFNDIVHSLMVLKDVGYTESFRELNLMPELTYPSFVTEHNKKIIETGQIDYIFSCPRSKCIATSVLKFYTGFIPVSDHWAVQAIFQL